MNADSDVISSMVCLGWLVYVVIGVLVIGRIITFGSFALTLVIWEESN